MVLSKQDILDAISAEIRLLLHLASKAGPEQLSFRPSEKQRSVLELLRYLAMFGPVHLYGILGTDKFDMAAWGAKWTEAAARVANLDAAAAIAEIAALPDYYRTQLADVSDEALREKVELFGTSGARAAWMLSLLISHYAAYRMQLFLTLKAGGLPQLNTMNLWVGIDGSMEPPPQ